jgi:hypothetical protein
MTATGPGRIVNVAGQRSRTRIERARLKTNEYVLLVTFSWSI